MATPTSNPARLRRLPASLTDEYAIRRLLSEYLFVHDSGDVARLQREYWTDDIVAQLVPFTVEGADAYARRLHDTLQPRIDNAGDAWELQVYTHFMGSGIVVTVEGETATASYSVLTARAERCHARAENYMWVQGMRYQDRFVRTAGGWRMSRRHSIADWRFEPKVTFAVARENFTRLPFEPGHHREIAKPQLADDLAIRSHLTEEYFSLDEGNFDRLRQKYWCDDISVEARGRTVSGLSQVVNAIQSGRSSVDGDGKEWALQVQTHYLGGTVISIDGNDATATYAVLSNSIWTDEAGKPRMEMQGARHQDRLKHVDGVWRTAKRRAEVDWGFADRVSFNATPATFPRFPELNA